MGKKPDNEDLALTTLGVNTFLKTPSGQEGPGWNAHTTGTFTEAKAGQWPVGAILNSIMEGRPDTNAIQELRTWLLEAPSMICAQGYFVAMCGCVQMQESGLKAHAVATLLNLKCTGQCLDGSPPGQRRCHGRMVAHKCDEPKSHQNQNCETSVKLELLQLCCR